MFKLKTFRGGIRLPEGKDSTKDRPIRTLPPAARLIVPLEQNAGKAPVPSVRPGDRVRAGEVIARPGGEISAFLHAPASGTIRSLGVFPHPVRGKGEAIEIETDSASEEVLTMPALSGAALTPEAIRARVLAAGVVGLGGAAFPTHVKLSPPGPIEVAIVNGAECEPFLTVDQRLLIERPADILAGLALAMQAVGAGVGIVALEENKRAAAGGLLELLPGYPGIEVRFLEVKYPQGAEKQMIYALLGREVPPGKLPSAVGCVVQNVHTAVAVADAVRRGLPLIRRVVTVAGPGVVSPGNFLVGIGTPLADLLEAAGGFRSGNPQVLAGGPMMGMAQSTLAAPVIKGTSGVIVVPPARARRNLPCIRCGNCIGVCPMGILPCAAARAGTRHEAAEFVRLGGMNCLECGCCAYVCPASRDLVQVMQLAKEMARRAGEG